MFVCLANNEGSTGPVHECPTFRKMVGGEYYAYRVYDYESVTTVVLADSHGLASLVNEWH